MIQSERYRPRLIITRLRGFTSQKLYQIQKQHFINLKVGHCRRTPFRRDPGGIFGVCARDEKLRGRGGAEAGGQGDVTAVSEAKIVY